MNWVTQPTDVIVGPLALKASGAEAVSTDNTAVEIGKGQYRIDFVVTAIDVASTDEFYNLNLEVNTRAATTTWKILGSVCIGTDGATAQDADDTTGTYSLIVNNPYDYQIRVASKIAGTSPSITYAVNAYPLARKA